MIPSPPSGRSGGDGGTPPRLQSVKAAKRYQAHNSSSTSRSSGDQKYRRKKQSLLASSADGLAWRTEGCFTSLSILLEIFLTWCHSIVCWLWYDFLRFDHGLWPFGRSSIQNQTSASRPSHRRNVAPGSSERAWWDTSKGSAIVLYGSGSQVLPQSLAISLASSRSSNGSQSRSRSPPHNISPSPPRELFTARLSSLLAGTPIGAAVRRLLQFYSRDLSHRGDPIHRTGRAPFTVIVLIPDPEDLSPLVRAWASRKAELERPRSSPPSPVRGPSGTSGDLSVSVSPELRASRPPSPRSAGSQPRKRTLSWGQWSASSGLVGFRDLWKGLRVGEETSRSDFGAVIPVVCDTSSAEGLEHAKSTVVSYCNSHNLLLRGLITISAAASPPLAEERNGKDQFFASTKSSDTGHDSYGLVMTMLPLLQRDKGRLITLQTPAESSTITPSLPRHYTNDVHCASTHLCEWIAPVVFSCLIADLHLSDPRYERGSFVELATASLKRLKLTSISGNIASLLTFTSSIFQLFLSPCILETSTHPESPSGVHGLLLHSIRSALSRTHPRKKYCIGFGPRIQVTAEMIPGVAFLCRSIADFLM